MRKDVEKCGRSEAGQRKGDGTEVEARKSLELLEDEVVLNPLAGGGY